MILSLTGRNRGLLQRAARNLLEGNTFSGTQGAVSINAVGLGECSTYLKMIKLVIHI